jgi:hypothetical protein
MGTDEQLREITSLLEHNTEKNRILAHNCAVLSDSVLSLSETVRRLPCLEPDTTPECPLALEKVPSSRRQTLHSIDEVVARDISARAPGFSYRGPGIMGIAIVLIAGVVMTIGLISGHVAIH